jgi:hypothetical protein
MMVGSHADNKALFRPACYGTVENHLAVVFITLGEPQAPGDTAEAVPFVSSRSRRDRICKDFCAALRWG